MTITRRFLGPTVFIGALLGLVNLTRAATFQGLGDLPGGNFNSMGHGVSANGSVVVGFSLTNPDSTLFEAFRWTVNGGLVGLGDLPGGLVTSAADGQCVSPDGQVVVGDSYSSFGYEAFRWTQASGMVGLGDLPGGFFDSSARAASMQGGVVVGVSRSSSGWEAFRWTQASGMVGLGDLSGGGFFSLATSISANGTTIVGHGRSAVGDEPFRWTSGGGMASLGDLPGGGVLGIAQDVSANGSVIVGSATGASGVEAFRWTQSTGMVGLGFLPGATRTELWGVASNGGMCVGSAEFESTSVAIVWDAVNGMRDLKTVLTNDFGLNLSGWTLEAATDISDDGRTIVGTGTNPSGFTEAWAATIPEFVVGVDGPSSVELTRLTSTPNPFQDATQLRFSLPQSDFADVTVYDVAGRKVKVLHAGKLDAGVQALRWDGTDDDGPVAAGAYYIQVRTSEWTLGSKVVRMR